MKIRKNNSPIFEINYFVSEPTATGKIEIVLTSQSHINGSGPRTLFPFFQANNILPSLRSARTLEGRTSAICFSPDNGNFRTIIHQLFQQGIISATDRADIEDDVRKVEQILAARSRIVDSISSAQTDILTDQIAPFIDGLFADHITSNEEFLPIMTFIYNAYHPERSQHGIIEKAEVWYKAQHPNASKEKVDDFVGLITVLSKYYNGLAALGSTGGAGIPSARQTQDLIFTQFKERFCLYPMHDFDAFYLEGGLRTLDNMDPIEISQSHVIDPCSKYPRTRGPSEGGPLVLLVKRRYYDLLDAYGLSRFPLSRSDCESLKQGSLST